jgi:hypothetical protein
MRGKAITITNWTVGAFCAARGVMGAALILFLPVGCRMWSTFDRVTIAFSAYVIVWLFFSMAAFAFIKLKPWQIIWLVVGIGFCLFASSVRESDPCHGDNSGRQTNGFWSFSDGH